MASARVTLAGKLISIEEVAGTGLLVVKEAVYTALVFTLSSELESIPKSKGPPYKLVTLPELELCISPWLLKVFTTNPVTGWVLGGFLALLIVRNQGPVAALLRTTVSRSPLILQVLSQIGALVIKLWKLVGFRLTFHFGNRIVRVPPAGTSRSREVVMFQVSTAPLIPVRLAMSMYCRGRGE